MSARSHTRSRRRARRRRWPLPDHPRFVPFEVRRYERTLAILFDVPSTRRPDWPETIGEVWR